jgi:hypothetical protein
MAYYAGYMVDRETQSLLIRYTGPHTFPKIMDEVMKDDFEALRVNCLEHESQLIQLLDRNGIEINAYQDILEFRQHFMEKIA